MEAPSPRNRVMMDGLEVEVWENPEVAFRCDPGDVVAHVAAGRWSLLFNAIVLGLDPVPVDELGTLQPPFAGQLLPHC